jgi:hypothetical protein
MAQFDAGRRTTPTIKNRFALLAITLSLACSCLAHAGDFSDGWKCGWKEGWRQVKGPYSLAPLAPLPPLGQDDYQDGFAAGVLAAARAAEEN